MKEIKKYTVYSFTDGAGAFPMPPIIGYIHSTDNGMTIIKDENNAIICVLTGNYLVIERPN